MVVVQSLHHFWLYGLQQARLPCPSQSPRACSDPSPFSWWCHPTISSSVVPFFSCLLSFPASRSFPMYQLYASRSQSIGASASASVLPMNIQGWFPLGWTGWISLQSNLVLLLNETNRVRKSGQRAISERPATPSSHCSSRTHLTAFWWVHMLLDPALKGGLSLATSDEKRRKKFSGGGFEIAGEIGCLCYLWVFIT